MKRVAVGIGGGVFFGVMIAGVLASIPALSPVMKRVSQWRMFLGTLVGGAAGYYYGANTCSGLSLSIEWVPQQ